MGKGEGREGKGREGEARGRGEVKSVEVGREEGKKRGGRGRARA